MKFINPQSGNFASINKDKIDDMGSVKAKSIKSRKSAYKQV